MPSGVLDGRRPNPPTQFQPKRRLLASPWVQRKYRTTPLWESSILCACKFSGASRSTPSCWLIRADKLRPTSPESSCRCRCPNSHMPLCIDSIPSLKFRTKRQFSHPGVFVVGLCVSPEVAERLMLRCYRCLCFASSGTWLRPRSFPFDDYSHSSVVPSTTCVVGWRHDRARVEVHARLDCERCQ